MRRLKQEYKVFTKPEDGLFDVVIVFIPCQGFFNIIQIYKTCWVDDFAPQQKTHFYKSEHFSEEQIEKMNEILNEEWNNHLELMRNPYLYDTKSKFINFSL